MANIVQQRYAASVIVIPGKVYAAGVACRGTKTSAHSSSVLAIGPQNYDGRLKNEPEITASVPNQFYGVAEFQPVSLEFDNLDGAMTHFLEDDERGSFMTIRRFDPVTGDTQLIASGVLDSFTIGDVVTMQLAPSDLGKLSDSFPKTLVTTTEFPYATDVGLPVPVVYGAAEDIPCPYVNHDDVNQNYDYLVGDGSLEVLSVEKDGIPSFVHPLIFMTVQGSTIIGGTAAYPKTMFPARLYLRSDDPYDPGTYTGFFMKGTQGALLDRVVRILSHDPAPPFYSSSLYDTLTFNRSSIGSHGFITYGGGMVSLSGLIPTVVAVTNFTNNTPAFSMTVSLSNVIGETSLIAIATQTTVSSFSDGVHAWSSIFNNSAKKYDLINLPNPGNPHLAIFSATLTTASTSVFSAGFVTPTVGVIHAFRVKNVIGAGSIVATHSNIYPTTSSYLVPKQHAWNGESMGQTPVALFAFASWLNNPAAIGAGTDNPFISAGLFKALTLEQHCGSGVGAIPAVGLASMIQAPRYAAKSMIVIDDVLTDAQAARIQPSVSSAQVQEYQDLPNTVYPGRTAIRFGRRQAVNDTFKTITANANRYQSQPRYNLLWASEDPDSALLQDRNFDASVPDVWTYSGTLPERTRLSTLVLDGTAPNLIGPGGETNRKTFYAEISTPGVVGALWRLEQIVTLQPARTLSAEVITLSFWYYSRADMVGATLDYNVTPTDATMNGSSTANIIDGSLVCDGSVGWKYVTITKSGSWGSSAVTNYLWTVIESSNFGLKPAAQFGFVHLELSSSQTIYEPTSRRSTRFRPGSGLWMVSDVIGELLRDQDTGLGDPVDTTSLDSAALTLLPAPGSSPSLAAPFAAAGSLPGPSKETPAFKDLLDELAQTRGIVVTKPAGAWVVQVDSAQFSSLATFGTEETPYRNVLSIQLAEKPSTSNSIKTQRLLFDPHLGLFASQLDSYFARGIDQTVGSGLVGVVKESPFRLLRDPATAQQTVGYLAAYAPALERAVTCQVGQEGAGLAPGGVIQLYAPRIQPQNLIPRSERDVTPDGWVQVGEGTGTAPTVSINCGLAPYGRSYSAWLMQFGAGGTGRSLTYSGKYLTRSAGPGGKAFARVWLKWAPGSTPGNCELLLRDAQTNGSLASYSKTVELGNTWQEYIFEQSVKESDVAFGMYFGIANPAGGAAKSIFGWGAQLNLDWLRGYTKTQGTAIDPTYIYKVTSATVSRAGASFTAIPYDTNALFAPYVPGTVFLPRVPDSVTTSFTVFPDSVDGLTVPPQTGAGVDTVTDSNGNVFVSGWAEIQFYMPQENAAGVRVQLQKVDDLGWSDVATVHNRMVGVPVSQTLLNISTLEAAPGGPVSVVARGLVVNMQYAVRCVSFDTEGRYSGLDVSKIFTIPA